MLRLLARIISVVALVTVLVLGTLWGLNHRYGWTVGPVPVVYRPFIPVVLFGLVLTSLSKGRPRWLPLVLGMGGFYLLVTYVWGFVGSWHDFGKNADELGFGPNGAAQGRMEDWAFLLALTGSAVLSAVARRRGGWAAVGWWGGSFIWLVAVGFGTGLSFDEGSYFYKKWPLSTPPTAVLVAAGMGFAVALSGLFWAARSKIRPTPLPVFLGAIGTVTLPFAIGGLLEAWRHGPLPWTPRDQEGALMVTAAVLWAGFGSLILAGLAARRGLRAAVGWWGGSFVWVFVVALRCAGVRLASEAQPILSLSGSQAAMVGGCAAFVAALAVLLASWGIIKRRATSAAPGPDESSRPTG